MKPKITGTWFQPFGKVDYPNTIFKKSFTYWKKEFAYMKQLDMKFFIFQFAAHNDIAYYDSQNFQKKQNILEQVRTEIEKNDLEFALGLYLNSEYYSSHDYQRIFEEQYQKTILVFDELFEKYKNFPNLKYWYIPQEIESKTFMNTEAKELLIAFMNNITSYIRKKSNLPIIIAPYFSMEEINQFKDWWSDFLNRIDIDIMIMQDGVGCYRNIKVENVESFYSVLKDICKESNVQFWSTLEIFQFVNAPDLNKKKIKIISGSWDRIKKQIQLNSQYVDRIIIFEFAHFMSPLFSRRAKKLFKEYLQYKNNLE